MLQYSFAGFEGEIQAIELSIPLLEHVHDAQALQIVLEAAVRLHARVERILSRMTEGCVSEIMRERDRFSQVLVEMEPARYRAANLRDFKAVRQAGSKEIAFVIDEDLGLVDQAPERGAVHDAIAVALVLAARRRR